MKHIALLVMLVGCINGIILGSDTTQQANNMAIHYMNAGQPIPDHVMAYVHPNARGYYTQHNTQVKARQAVQPQWPPAQQ